MRIFIKNETDKNLSVTLFPKLKYLNGDLYDDTAIGGGFRETTLEITPRLDEVLYITNDLKIQPNNLTAQVFDSIQISLPDGHINTIKFSPDTVIGYTENLYKETSHWVYEIRNFNLYTSFQSNPVEFHDYTFVISPDNFMKEIN